MTSATVNTFLSKRQQLNALTITGILKRELDRATFEFNLFKPEGIRTSRHAVDTLSIGIDILIQLINWKQTQDEQEDQQKKLALLNRLKEINEELQFSIKCHQAAGITSITLSVVGCIAFVSCAWLCMSLLVATFPPGLAIFGLALAYAIIPSIIEAALSLLGKKALDGASEIKACATPLKALEQSTFFLPPPSNDGKIDIDLTQQANNLT